MNFNDETLMTYADGEADAATRAAIEAAMANDAALAARVESHRALRGRVQGAYASALSEAAPARLASLTERFGDAQPAQVLDFSAARERRGARRAPRAAWPWLGGIAATVLLGVMVGRVMQAPEAVSMVKNQDGSLVADAALSDALNKQLARTQAQDAPVKIALSFRAKGGEFCRAFTATAGDTAGVACRAGETWRVVALTHEKSESDAGVYRQAASALPLSLLQKIDGLIAGEALDAAAESAAAAKGWR